MAIAIIVWVVVKAPDWSRDLRKAASAGTLTGCNLTVKVEDARTGAHVPNAIVYIAQLGTDTIFNALTNEDGIAQFEAGEGRVKCSVDAFGYKSTSAEEAELSPGENHSITIKLEPLIMRTISGTVTDAETGEPIPGVYINISSYSTQTGPDGKYKIVAYPGTYHITCIPAEHIIPKELSGMGTPINAKEDNVVFDIKLSKQ